MTFLASSRTRSLLLGALTCVLLFPGLNRGGLSGYDDALYAHEAKEMLRSGDWRNVRFNSDLNFEYPPLFIWMEAASMHLFGVNDFAAKLPVALCGLASVLVLYLIALQLRGNEWFASMAMLVLASTQPFLKYSGHAMTDVPFTLLFLLALLFYLKGLEKPRFFPLAGLAVGLAILTRSVLGVLPLTVMLGHLAATRRLRLLALPSAVGALVISTAVPLLWFGSQYAAFGYDFVDAHLAFVFRKVDDGESGVQGIQVLPYILELIRYYWPWLPVLLAGAYYQLRGPRNYLAVLWTLAVFGSATMAAIPYGRYLIPAYPAMAILCAVALERWIPVTKRATYFSWACAALLIAGAYAVLIPAPERGVDIRTLAPIAEDMSRPGDRVLLYTRGERLYEFQNQLLWYADRYTDHVIDMEELVAKNEPGRVGVIDKASFLHMPDHESMELLGESESFYCYRVPSS